jgi:pimeloyl-ACP methyl ester carboxylesterase
MMIPAGQSTFSCLFSCFVTLWFSVFGAAVTGDDQPSVPLVTLNDLKLPSEFQQHQIAISEDGGSEEILSCYRRTGTGATVLLIPGTFSDARIFAPMLRFLDPSLDVIILENRGLGGSWPPPVQCSIELCARDALQVLDALNVKSCFVGGHSLGGMISLEIGRQQPKRIRGIISIEGWTSAAAAEAAFHGDMRSTQSDEQRKVLAEYRADVLRRWSPEQIKMFGSIWRQWDGSEFLQTTHLPILELYGDRGKPRPERGILGIPDKPGIRLSWLAGASHSLLIERPREVAEATGQFIAAFICAESGTVSDELRADLVVVGGSPGGISAALAAAALGRSVLLIESHPHLGGMMTSGLGKSDIENKEKIGGIFRDFTQRVYRHYVNAYGPDHENVKRCQEGYYYEPSVAESVLESMLKEYPSITIMRDTRLTSATVVDNRITHIGVMQKSSETQRKVSGGVFVDATYEGDLFAAAGVGFRQGRESKAEFQEAHAGVIYFDYQRQQFLAGSTGAGDDRIPAYTYRLCLTTDPANAVPLKEPPEGYNRNNYLGYFEDLQAGRLAGPKTFKPGRGYNPAHFNTLVRALSVTPLPNDKTDVNMNPRPLGFPFAEMNRGYLEGDEAVRQKICAAHRQMTLGLLWFLQHDEQVPEAHRRLARELHLPADEFIDNGHFPFQLYVREGRRLKGLYTLTENDITGSGEDRTPVHHPDSIAVGEFPIDSFPCRIRQPDDTIVLEGYLGMLDYITRPYEIPYRIMIPEALDGLIVPVAASTTHVAYSSIRMEPTWMALGQAAGTAAHLALRDQLPLRSVPIAELQQILVSHGQVINQQEPSELCGAMGRE